MLATWAPPSPTRRLSRGKGKYTSNPGQEGELTFHRRIRFAAPPTGPLRFQAPQVPAINRTAVIPATAFGSQCYQAYYNFGTYVPLPAAGSEDCLFLNVYAPANASNLPVFVWFHGGGYGLGNGQQDLSGLINGTNNSFIGVAIQYRVSRRQKGPLSSRRR